MHSVIAVFWFVWENITNMKKRIIYASVAILIIIVITIIFIKPQSLFGDSCGTIRLNGGLSKPSSVDKKEKAVECMKNSLEVCKNASMSVLAYSIEGEPSDEHFHIRNEGGKCHIEKIRYNEVINSCTKIGQSEYVDKASNTKFYSAVMQDCTDKNENLIFHNYKSEKIK